MSWKAWSDRIEKKNLSSFQSMIFLSSFAVLLVMHGIENTSVIYQGYGWMNILYTFKKVIYLIILGKIVFFSKYKIKDIIFIGVLLSVSILSYLQCDDFSLVELFIILIGAKDVSFKHIARIYLLLKSIFIPLTLIAYKLGILTTLYYYNGSKGYYNTLGFCHRNVLGANFAIMCLVWFMLRYEKLVIGDGILWIVIAIFSYRLAYSKSSVIIIILITIFVFGYHAYERVFIDSYLAYQLILLGFLGMIFISVFCTVFYNTNSAFWKIVNSAFTLRFSSSNYCLKQFGVTLFGQDIPFVSSFQAQMSGTQKLILDNTYVRLLLYYGVVPGVMFFCIYLRAIMYSFLDKNANLVFCLFIMSVYGLSERYMMDIYYQLPLLLAFQYFFSKPGEKRRL